MEPNELSHKKITPNAIVCDDFIEAAKRIDRFAPSSKCCHRCGWKNVNLTLKDRVFVCQGCELKMDRDLNAALNIRNIGLSMVAKGNSTILRDTQKSTPVEIGGCRTSVQCQSGKQEKFSEGLGLHLCSLN